MIKYFKWRTYFITNNIDDHHAKRIINFLCPTSVSHYLGKEIVYLINFNRLYLGLDIHDWESISYSEQLQPGNVLL
jgi:hypothetical protein